MSPYHDATTHELAKLLLAGPDLPLVIMDAEYMHGMVLDKHPNGGSWGPVRIKHLESGKEFIAIEPNGDMYGTAGDGEAEYFNLDGTPINDDEPEDDDEGDDPEN